MSDAQILQLQNIEKTFDSAPVLRGVSLSVQRGEFVTILGPSGCGKTTTLRIIAGLTQPDSGRVILSGEDVTQTPPNKRNVNTVFQNYALFPHMNVARNIGYGLRLRGESRAHIKQRTDEMLALVQLPGFSGRMPNQLSGGQRQRVAIARAVVLQPHVLLLDEPLGALDLQLRQQMQGELKLLQKQLGITFIYITHDQEEALNMSDRIAVMQNGQFEQIGTPEDIYERPRTRFAAQFIGQGSLFEGEVLSCEGDTCRVRIDAGTALAAHTANLRPGDRCAVSVHAERIRFSAEPQPGFELPATVVSHRFSGSVVHSELALKTGEVITALSTRALGDLPAVGAAVHISFEPRHCALIAEARA